MPSQEPCDACTGDGGQGHTMRGACGGAPCEVCGDARYLHLPGDCQDDNGSARSAVNTADSRGGYKRTSGV